MSTRNSSLNLLNFSSGLIFMTLIAFSVLRWLEIPAGSFLDWIIGIASFAWLMVVATVPWNIYFEARTVLEEARISREKQINIKEKDQAYVKRVAGIALFSAILLHILSAAVLYYIAYQEISVVGYYAAWAALLLTFLRPALRMYEYLSERLYAIRQEILYPREDIDALKYRVLDLENQLAEIWNTENEFSFRNTQAKTNEELMRNLKSLFTDLKNLKESNEEAHQTISKETRHAVAQLTEDGKFIEHILEIIRFIKRV